MAFDTRAPITVDRGVKHRLHPIEASVQTVREKVAVDLGLDGVESQLQTHDLSAPFNGTLKGNYDTTAGLYDAASNHLFVLDRSQNPRKVLEIDPATELVKNDDEANSYLTRKYRAPFTVPEAV